MLEPTDDGVAQQCCGSGSQNTFPLLSDSKHENTFDRHCKYCTLGHDSGEVGEVVSEIGSKIINVTLAAIIAGDHLVPSYPRTCCFPNAYMTV